MSDERVEQDQQAAHVPELSATPFGAGANPAEGENNDTPAQETKTEQAQPSAESEDVFTMEAAMAGMGEGTGVFKRLTPGDVVDGVVVHIDKDGVLVDVGTKSEGSIKPTELSSNPNLTPEEVVAVGDKIRVYVVQPESQDGGPVLSKKRADFENAWERVEKAFGDGEVLKAMVMDRVKGGLVVDLGIRGFVPASHVGSGKLKNLDKYVGQSLQFKVIEVDRERRKVVLSNRLAVEEEREKQRTETMAEIAEGQIREGVVRRLTDYGAFIDLGGVDGLLHISEMSWTRIKHPSEVVKPGQKLQVQVLKLDLGNNRVSLGLRQILPDPWENVKKLYSVGDIIKGTVTRIVPFGAFVQVDGGVEGIIPNSELAHKRINNPEEVVSSGQEVEIKVIDLRADERRLTLSLRQLTPPPVRERDTSEEPEYRSYSQNRASESRTTIADLIGDAQLGELGFNEEKKPKKSGKKAKREALEEQAALEEADFMTAEDFEAEIAAPEAAETTEAVAETEAEAPTEEVAEEPAAEVVEVAAEEVVEETAAEAVEVDAEEVVEEPVAEAEEITEEPKAEEESAPEA